MTPDDLAKTGLLRYLQSQNPQVNLILVADGIEFAGLGMALHASGYLTRPLTEDALKAEFSSLRFAPAKRQPSSGRKPAMGDDVSSGADLAPSSRTKGLYVQTFGNFEVFYDGVPVLFKCGRTKELFAYMIDRRGAMVSNGEFVSVLWADGRDFQHSSYLRTLKLDLEHTFEKLGCSDALIRGHGTMGCNPAKIPCDYFYHLSEYPEATSRSGILEYCGEYMCQFGWAEATKGMLSR